DAQASYSITMDALIQQAKLIAADCGTRDHFGCSVALSSDGNTAIAGAWGEDTGYKDQGAAYVFAVGTTPPTDSGPTIKANGAAGTITVYYPNTVSITVAMNAGIYAGADVDWWVIVFAHSGGWYYLNSAMQWALFSGDLAFCQPVYQGPLFNLSSITVLDRYQLSRGTYDFWFAVDYPMDGILNLNGLILYDKVTVVVQ
ncbi:MAG: FG-GAP repeat protein, partial [Kiritimatiellia bacterium]|nr:FG-GAP repeat protein [Kiritimatiellia bacterium]